MKNLWELPYDHGFFLSYDLTYFIIIVNRYSPCRFDKLSGYAILCPSSEPPPPTFTKTKAQNEGKPSPSN